VNEPALFKFLPLSRRRVAVAGLILLAFALSIVMLLADVVQQIERESEARSDNSQWALSQIEVELLRLVLAVDTARNSSGALDDTRLRFDVFYSRLLTLQKGRVFAGVRERPEYQQSFGRLDAFARRTLPLIDGPDSVLRVALPMLAVDATQMIGDARTIALTGVDVIAKASDQDRDGVARTLILAAALTGVLVALLVTLVVMLLQLYRFGRQRAQETLATLSRLDAIVASASEAIVTVDSQGRIVDFNQQASTILGYARAEVVGRDMAQLQAVEMAGHVLFVPGGPPGLQDHGRVRVLARHRDGRTFPAELSISQTGDGDSALYVAFVRDLSLQLATEQALIAARDEARAGEKAKADLLVVMSHEIRTPLNGMIGTMDLLEASDLLPHQREYLRIMETSGQLLMRHVNDVLDIARLDSGKTPLTITPVNLVSLVGEVVENQRHASQSNGNQIHFTGPPEDQSTVKADRALLQQVLLNLVGNAVKFTRNGQINITVAHLTDKGPTEIVISDTGIGIPKADLDRIFDDFVTLDATYARRASGTGLGLGIVRRIVDRMGGELTVSSQEGKSSTFKVVLPLEIVDTLPSLAQTSVPVATGQPRPLGILVVEDNDFNRLIVRAMLLKDGHEVFEARDGADGITLANARRFDLILMDISMPNVDGLQAAQAILTGGGASADTPIVAMTAHALADETTRFRQGGMSRVLVKPITRDMLRSVVAELGGSVPHDGDGPVAPRLVDITVLRALQDDLGAIKTAGLVRKFLSETGASLDQIMRTLTNSKADPQVLHDLHQIQGSAAMFGALALQAHLSGIVAAWKHGRIDEFEGGLTALDCIWKNTEKAFQELGILAQTSSLR
jgi:PAS domain S-box-containing protein